MASVIGCTGGRLPLSPDRDGPPLVIPEGLALTPDAVPRVEPLRNGGPNKPNEVHGQRQVPLTVDLPLSEVGGLVVWPQMPWPRHQQR